MVNSVAALGGGASSNGRDLIGLTQGRRSVFLESSWNARHAVSRETPALSSNVSHKHQEAITDHHHNQTHKWIRPVLFHYSQDCCMLEWGRREAIDSVGFAELYLPMASEALNAGGFWENQFWEVRQSEMNKPNPAVFRFWLSFRARAE